MKRRFIAPVGVAWLTVLAAVLAASLGACSTAPAKKPVSVLGATLTQPTVRSTLTTAAPAPTDTTAPPAPASPAHAAPVSTRPQPAVSPTTLACIESHDPACGPMYFNPAPGPDLPLHIGISASPAHPTAGQTVTFHIVMDDPDGPIGCVQRVSDGQTSSVNDCGLPLPCDRFGAWPPPPPAPGHAEQDVTATYRRPGQYTFTISVVPNSSSCTDSRTHRGEQPYVSAGSGSLTVTIA
jgi:hypothetical protein